LHQALYGAHVFPLQATILLSKPGTDFEGGEFVVTDAGSREKRADVLQLTPGDAVILEVNQRPVTGSRGPVKTTMRHGASRQRGPVNGQAMARDAALFRPPCARGGRCSRVRSLRTRCLSGQSLCAGRAPVAAPG